jgi:hypothetical protein
MHVVYATELPPESFSHALFLAGPTPRSAGVKSWRPGALRLLCKAGYDGVVFVPEPRNGKWHEEYTRQIEWEEQCLHMADCILFWVPRDLDTMPAFTTNDEWGAWKNSGKVVFASPPRAAKVQYQRYYAEKLRVPMADSLPEAIRASLELIGEGALRIGGERNVPLHIWRTSHFQQWLSAQKAAGNRLDGAQLEWVFTAGSQKYLVSIHDLVDPG